MLRIKRGREWSKKEKKSESRRKSEKKTERSTERKAKRNLIRSKKPNGIEKERKRDH